MFNNAGLLQLELNEQVRLAKELINELVQITKLLETYNVADEENIKQIMNTAKFTHTYEQLGYDRDIFSMSSEKEIQARLDSYEKELETLYSYIDKKY